MSAPTNIDFASATDLGTTLPVTYTQTADDAGTTYDLFFKRTVQSGETEWSVFGFGDLITYTPDTNAYDETFSLIQSGASNKTILVSVTERVGEVIYLRVNTNGGNPSPAELTLSIELGTNASVPNGSIAVNDDTIGGPQVYYGTNGQILRFRAPYPNSDFNDTLPSGYVMAYDSDTATWFLFSPTEATVGTPALPAGFRRVTSNQVNLFYLGNPTDGTVTTVDTLGVVGGTTWTVTGAGNMQAIAPTIDDTILYVVDSGTNKPIKRWDLVNDMALTNLAAGIVNYQSPPTLLVLTDGTILAGYQKTSATADYKVLHYSAAGATLHTYSFGTTVLHQLNHALNDAVSFWVWLDNADDTFEFREIAIADGSTLTSVTKPDYSGGVYQGAVTATPVRFGNSSSCQFYIVRSTATDTTTFTIRRQRRWLLPSSESDNNMQIPTLQLLLRTGIGLLPDAAGSSTPLGVNPEARLRISKDGGKTWGPERARSAGLRGEFKDRVTWTRATGNYRNGVGEVTVDAPVDWQWLAMIAKRGIIEGSS